MTVAKRPGSTLLLSLLVLSTVLIVSVSVSEVARTEILIGRSTDHTSIATYAAESALEEGAYQARKNPDSTVLQLQGTTRTLSNGASFTRQADNKTGQLSLARLPKDAAVGFDLYDPDTGLASGKESIRVVVDSCAGNEVIELGFTAWDPATGSFNPNFQKFRYSCPAGSGYQILNNDIISSRTYRLYVRSLTANVGSLRVWACSSNDGAGVCDMPGRLNLTVTGEFNRSRRVLGLDMPRLPAVSGIYSYTVFTECQIIKDPNDPNPPC